MQLIQLQTSNFQFLQSGCICKILIRRTVVLVVVVVILFRRIGQISRSYFLTQNLEIFLALLISLVRCICIYMYIFQDYSVEWRWRALNTIISRAKSKSKQTHKAKISCCYRRVSRGRSATPGSIKKPTKYRINIFQGKNLKTLFRKFEQPR